jgi:hypothetical protein
MRLRQPISALAACLLVACQSTPEPMTDEPGIDSRGVPSTVAGAVPASSGAGVGAAAEGPCLAGQAVQVWATPSLPRPGEPLRLVAVATDGPLDQLVVTGPDGAGRMLPASPSGGPPWGLRASFMPPTAGTYQFAALRGGESAGCAEVPVGAGPLQQGSGRWDLAANALYAVWVEQLFDAPPEQTLSFPSLTPVIADPGRNLLYNYLGAGEDKGLRLEPDCADLPYILRAYFAWKLGLPVSYRACSRGSASSPPRCQAATVETPPIGASASTFRGLSGRIMNTVHSGSGRTALADDATDFYPVPLERSALWPGTLYADPYGHTLVLVKWLPQAAGRPGMLLAVDAQPDNSVNRKRFWEGTFLFADTPSAGPGFKAFRPMAGGAPRPMNNAELRGGGGSPPYSLEQASLSPEGFYTRMQRLINPAGLDPTGAYDAALAALMEQLQTRVASVQRGEDYMRGQGGRNMSMPNGAAIFETTGPWEDYSTPSRDMRLLIAMNVVEGLPDRIRRYPELYRLGGETPGQAAARIAALHAQRISERSISYQRSDGSPWRLSVAELYARRPALELAYNPNDCIERRWGAPDGSQEQATCARRAPRDQQAKMNRYRSWFRETRRPPR